MKTLTVKQEAISKTEFKCRLTGKKFRVDVRRPCAILSGQPAYFLTGSNNLAFTEDVLMTAIYKGYYKKGLTNIIACKKQIN